MTCTYFITGKRVLMADQQKKIIGTKGYGGRMLLGESWQGCCGREIREESGGDPNRRVDQSQQGGLVFLEKDLTPFALIDFYNGTETDIPFGKPSCRVLFSKCTTYSGRAIDTYEMRNPKFYWIHRLPYKKMISGDKYFITLQTLLGDECMEGWIRHTSDFKTVLGKEVKNCSREQLVF